jgi:hypothetical protein
MDIQFEEMASLGSIDDYLIECGYILDNQKYVPQIEMVGIERSFIEFAEC